MSVLSDIVGGVTTGASAATPTGAVSAVAKVVSQVIDIFHPDPAVANEMKLKLLELEQSGRLAEMTQQCNLNIAQIEVNKVEAASPNLFVSGWRPAVGWVCVFGLLGQYFVGPTMTFISHIFGSDVIFPELDLASLIPLLIGMLGLAGIRSFEKVKGVS